MGLFVIFMFRLFRMAWDRMEGGVFGVFVISGKGIGFGLRVRMVYERDMWLVQ